MVRPKFWAALVAALFLYASTFDAQSSTYEASGDTIVVTGEFEKGEHIHFGTFLKSFPDTKTVVFKDHVGGNALSAMYIGAEIRDKSLQTRVEGACASACIMAFAGGVTRSVADTGALMTHQLDPGPIDPAPGESVQVALGLIWMYYEALGLDAPGIIRPGLTHPNRNAEFYTFTREELARLGFIN